MLADLINSALKKLNFLSYMARETVGRMHGKSYPEIFLWTKENQVIKTEVCDPITYWGSARQAKNPPEPQLELKTFWGIGKTQGRS